MAVLPNTGTPVSWSRSALVPDVVFVPTTPALRGSCLDCVFARGRLSDHCSGHACAGGTWRHEVEAITIKLERASSPE